MISQNLLGLGFNQHIKAIIVARVRSRTSKGITDLL